MTANERADREAGPEPGPEKARRPLELDRLAPEAVPGIRVLPVVHGRIEMAAVVRWVIEAAAPAAVAVELPTTVAVAAQQAVARLPRISLLLAEEPGEPALIWPVAPGEPFAEALRWAHENGLPSFCIDPDIAYEERHQDVVPDAYSMWSLDPATYLDLAVAGVEPSANDRRREAGMAHFARRAARGLDGGPLLVLVGAAHAVRVARDLRGETAHPLARVHRSHVELRHLHPDSLTGLLSDPPLAHAVWERVRGGEVPAAPELSDALSRRVSLERFGLRVIAGEGGRDEEHRRRRLVDLAAAEAAPQLCGRPAPDRRALARVVWRVAAGSYREQTGEAVTPWQRRLFFDFTRRYGRLSGLLAPSLYEWVAGARGVGDDNLAWEVFQAGRTYPWQEESAELATARVDGSELDLGSRKIRFRRRFLRSKRRPVGLKEHRRAGPEEALEWLQGFDSEGICSYPPEDLVVEDYGRFLQRKAVSILSAEQSRSEPFSTSLLDGIDIRETLLRRNEGRIWVREIGRAPAAAGSVVVIFEPPESASSYPFRMTWLGEHDQESDMAFYATEPTAQVVGPGIMRATYGGFLLTNPRGRLFDVWADADYRFVRRPEDVLLLAGIDYSEEKIVVHMGPAAPSDSLRRHAAAQGKRIVHIPLASLSPATRKRLRVVHLLSGHDKRPIAGRYIW